MADDTILIDIEYNTDEAEKEIDSLTSSIEGLTVAQAQLKDQVEKGQISDVEASKQKAKIQTQLQTEKKQRKDLIKIVQAETGSRDKMRLTISKLIKERDSLDTSTAKGAKRSEELKEKIDQLTKAQKASGVAAQQQKDNIGNYAESLKASEKGQAGFIGGMKGMIKSSLAFIATPLGAVIAAIVGVFKLLQKAFQRSEGRMNKMRVVTGKLSGVFNGLMKILEPVVDFIVDNVIAAFDALGNAVDKTVGFVSRALGKLGFEKAAEKVDNFQKKMNAAAVAGENLAKAEAKLTQALRFAEKTQLDFQKLAERQRQIRDDEARSIDDRIAANQKLGNILKQQMASELDIANQQLKVAEMRIALEGDSTDNLDARAEALTRISDIQERVESQASEQLVNINSLQKERNELLEKEKELLAVKLEDQQKVIDDEVEAEIARIDESLTREKEAIDQSVENWQEGEEAKTEDTKRQSEMRRDLVKQSLGAIQDITGSATQFLIDQNNQRLNAELIAAGDNEEKKAAIEKKFAKRNQKLAIRQAIVKGSLVVLNALATVPFIPSGLIAAGAAAVATGFQIATIRNQKFKKGGQVPLAKRGMKAGTFSGPSHVHGGIPIVNGLTGQPIAEVEGKENFYVVNKNASSYINSLSDINQRIGGGVPLSSRSTRMQDGGQADVNGAEQGININDVTERVVQNLPPIVVQTVDIKTGLEDRNDVLNVGVV